MSSHKQCEISQAIGRDDYATASTLIQDRSLNLFDYIRHPKHVLNFSRVSTNIGRFITAQPERLSSDLMQSIHVDETVVRVYVSSNPPSAVTFLKRQSSFWGEINRATGDVTLYTEKSKLGSGGGADVYLYVSEKGKPCVVKKSRQPYDLVLASEAQDLYPMDTLYLNSSSHGALQCVIYDTTFKKLIYEISAENLNAVGFDFDYPLTPEALTLVSSRTHHLHQLLMSTTNFNPYWLYKFNSPPKMECIRNEYDKEFKISEIGYQSLGTVDLFTFVRAQENQYAARFILPYAPGDGIRQVELIINEHVLAQVCLSLLNALSALHAKQILHGDLKLDNIRLFIQKKQSSANRESFIQLILIDFGHAYRSFEKARVCSAAAAQKCGAFHWAPERRTNNQNLASDPNQDVFSLGYTLQQMLNISPAGARLKITYPSIPQYIAKAMEIDPKQRPTLVPWIELLKSEIASKKLPQPSKVGRSKVLNQPLNTSSRSKKETQPNTGWGCLQLFGMWRTGHTTSVSVASTATASDLLNQRHAGRFRPGLC